MPSFTVPLHEFNDCHAPDTGRFCSEPGQSSPPVVSSSVDKKQKRLARQSGVKYASYTDTTGKLEREHAAKQALIDYVDRYGSITVQVGIEGKRKFGQRKLEMLMKLERAGVLERLPSQGRTPIMSRAPHLLNKVRGWGVEHTFRRKRS